MPEQVTNRARDNWRVLKAIASVAGGNWPDHIDEAAKAAQGRVEDEASRLELLLEDIRAVGFSGNDTEVRSADLVQHLIELEGRPWAEFEPRQASDPEPASSAIKAARHRSGKCGAGRQPRPWLQAGSVPGRLRTLSCPGGAFRTAQVHRRR